MSYSFSVTKPTKTELVDAISAEMAKVVASQPVHEADAGKAIEVSADLLGMLQDDAARDVTAAVNGSIWKTDAGIQSLALSVSVGFAAPRA